MVGIINKIVLQNYCLSVFLSKGRKDLIKNGTWFLLANELFFISISLGIFIISMFDFIIPDIFLLLLFITIWWVSFYGTKKWVLNKIEKKKIDSKYKTLQSSIAVNTIFGAILFLGSFLLVLLVMIKTFKGYSI